MIKKLSMLFISLVFLTPFVPFISLEAKEPVQVEPYSIEEARQDALDMGVNEENIDYTLSAILSRKPLESMSKQAIPSSTVNTQNGTIDYFSDGSFRATSISGGSCSNIGGKYGRCYNRKVKYIDGYTTMYFYANYTNVYEGKDYIDKAWGQTVKAMFATNSQVYFDGDYSREKGYYEPATATYSVNITGVYASGTYTLELRVGRDMTKVAFWY